MKKINLLLISFLLTSATNLYASDSSKKIMFIEGDIAVYKDKYERAKERKRRGLEAAPDLASRLWKKGVVPFVFAKRDRGNQRLQNAANDGMQVLMDQTNIKFVQRTSQKDYIVITSKDSGCWSFVGRVRGAQTVNLGKGCQYTYIAAHELMHAMGVQHEQSRPDRDDYINLNLGNVKKKYRNNFNIAPRAIHGEYDYNSIMHYGSYDFSKNGRPVITKKDGTSFRENRSYLSSGDIAGINYLYPSDGVSPEVNPRDFQLILNTKLRSSDGRYEYSVKFNTTDKVKKHITKVKFALAESSFTPYYSNKADGLRYVFYSFRDKYDVNISVILSDGKVVNKKFKLAVNIDDHSDIDYSSFNWNNLKVNYKTSSNGKLNINLNGKKDDLDKVKSVKYFIDELGLESSDILNSDSNFKFTTKAVNYEGTLRLIVKLKDNSEKEMFYNIKVKIGSYKTYIKTFGLNYSTKKSFFSRKVKYSFRVDIAKNMLKTVSYVDYRVVNSRLRTMRVYNSYGGFGHAVIAYSSSITIEATVVLKNGKKIKRRFKLRNR